MKILQYLDSHCHIDLFDNMKSFINDLSNYKHSIMTMTTTPLAYKKNQELCDRYTNVFVALGLHPQLIAEREEEEIPLLKQIETARFIGEIGLDLGPQHYRTSDIQIRILNAIIDRCDWYGNKIISIHSVRSAEIVLEILRSNIRNKTNSYIMHWFSGSDRALRDAIKLNCYFSINKQMARSTTGKKVIALIPKERILLESDAPFVTTFKVAEEHSHYLNQVVEMICEIREENISKQISLNGISLLS